LFFVGCEHYNQLKVLERQESKEETNLLALIQIRNKGNCKIQDTSTQPTTILCNKKPFGLCNEDLYVVTVGEKSKLSKGASDIIKLEPKCQYAFLQSGITNLTVSTNADKDNIRKRYTFEPIESCMVDGFVDADKLLVFDELIFLESAKGRIGEKIMTIINSKTLTTSIKSDANQCLNTIFSTSEKTLLEEVYSNTKKKEAIK
jgi:hypothetical protein